MMRKQSNWVIEEKALESMKTKLIQFSSSVQYNPIQRSNSFNKKQGSSLTSTNNNSSGTYQPIIKKPSSHELTKSNTKIEYNAISVQDRKIIRGLSSGLIRISDKKKYNDYSIDNNNDSILSKMKVTKMLIPIQPRKLDYSVINRDSSDSSKYQSIKSDRGKFNSKRKLFKDKNINNRNNDQIKKQSLSFTKQTLALHTKRLSSFKDHLNDVIKQNSQIKKSQFFFNKNIKGFICTKNGNKRKTNDSSTLLIKTNTVKENIVKRLLLHHGSSSLNSTIRLKSLNWLWTNKTLLLESLILSYCNYKWFLDKNKLMAAKVLSEFMSVLKMTKDDEFIKGVFMIFDTHKLGVINVQEMFLNFIMTSSSSYEIKVSHILELVLDDNKNILLIDLIQLLKFVIPKVNLRKLSQILNARFTDYQLEAIRVSFNALYSFLINDDICIQILKNKMLSYTQDEVNLEQDIISACVSNMKNSLNYLSDHSTRMFRQNDFVKFNHILDSVQICRIIRKKHRSINSEENK